MHRSVASRGAKAWGAAAVAVSTLLLAAPLVRGAGGEGAEPAPVGSATPAAPAASSAGPTAGESVRGPANDVVAEASIGYGVGTFTAIEGHDPRVTNGPLFHLGLGWAWPIRANQSLGIQAFADGTWDGDRSSLDGAALASRIGGAAFVTGEHAHLRLGFGYAHATFDGGSYGGLGLGFAAGWHTPIVASNKSLAFTFDVLPSWDFLGAGSQTLHRWNFGLALGLALL